MIRIAAILLIVGAVGCRQAADDARALPALALAHVTVVDVREARLLDDMTVVIDGQYIAAVESSRTIGMEQGLLRTIDATGLYVVPGLWDMHVHLAEDPAAPWQREIVLPLLVANGVTGVRDMGSDPGEVMAWRRDIQRGLLQGPHIFAAGLMLDGPKPLWPSSRAVGTATEGRAAVASLNQFGVDFIKVQSGVPKDAFLAIADEANRRNLSVAGHVPFAMTAAGALSAGMHTAEHIDEWLLGLSTREEALKSRMFALTAGGQFPNAAFMRIQQEAVATYDAGKAERLWQQMVERRTGFCPTLRLARTYTTPADPALWADPRLRYVPATWREMIWKPALAAMSEGLPVDGSLATLAARHRDVVASMSEAGVAVLACTDLTAPLVIPGFGLHDELRELAEAGMSPAAVLRSATINAASILGRLDQFGTIEPGKHADLVVLTANPLVDVTNLQLIRAIVLEGRLLDRTDLDAMLVSVERIAARH